MKTRTRIFAAMAAVGIMGVGALAIAQPGGGCDGRMGMMSVRFDPAARADQHLARLKADLKLTATQEPLWQAFAEKAKSEAGKGFTAMRENSQDLGLSAPDRMAKRTEIMKDRVAAMESVNATFRPLYESLSVEQKRVADIYAARIGHGGRHGRMGRGGPQGPANAPAAPTNG